MPADWVGFCHISAILQALKEERPFAIFVSFYGISPMTWQYGRRRSTSKWKLRPLGRWALVVPISMDGPAIISQPTAQVRDPSR